MVEELSKPIVVMPLPEQTGEMSTSRRQQEKDNPKPCIVLFFPPLYFIFLKEHGSNYVLAFPLQKSEVLMGTEHQKCLI